MRIIQKKGKKKINSSSIEITHSRAPIYINPNNPFLLAVQILLINGKFDSNNDKFVFFFSKIISTLNYLTMSQV